MSSARLHGGRTDAYLALHGWFDASKAVYCDFRHRALRHHREGVAEAEQLFGATIPNGAGRRVAIATLGLQHLAEDGGRIPTAADWLVDLQPPPGLLPAVVPEVDDLSAASVRHFGGDTADYRPLHAWFLAARTWMPDPRHLALRHHAFGVFEAEARFGAVLQRADGSVVPTRVVAERHVRTIMGRVPPAHTLLRHIRGQPWMVAAQHPDRLRRRQQAEGAEE